MSKRIGILFSGGLDSTYLVWDNLKKGNEVVPIYIEITNNGSKTILEKNRVKLLFEKFRDEFENNINYIEYVLTAGLCANEDSLYFKQVPIFILGLMFCQSMGLDEIQIGYVGNDDAIPFLNDIEKIYKSYKSYKSIQENLVPLKFPLKKLRKYELGAGLPTSYLDLIISCENPRIIGSETADFIEYEPCCECAPCKTIIHTEYYGLGFPKLYKEKLTKLKIDELSREGYKIIDSEGVDCSEDMCKVLEVREPYQLKLDLDWSGIDMKDANIEQLKKG